jgi:hypothetical protein
VYAEDGALVPGIEAWVWERVDEILSNPSIITAELERREQNGPDESLSDELQSASSHLQTLDKKQKRLMQRFAEGDDDDSEVWELLKEQIDRLGREKGTVSATITDIRHRMAEA